jgi:hypothetical protein
MRNGAAAGQLNTTASAESTTKAAIAWSAAAGATVVLVSILVAVRFGIAWRRRGKGGAAVVVVIVVMASGRWKEIGKDRTGTVSESVPKGVAAAEMCSCSCMRRRRRWAGTGRLSLCAAQQRLCSWRERSRLAADFPGLYNSAGDGGVLIQERAIQEV